MSVIKLSTPAASCWTTWVVEGHSPAAKPGLSENGKVSSPPPPHPRLVSHALGSSVYPGFTHDFLISLISFLQGNICHKPHGLSCF